MREEAAIRQIGVIFMVLAFTVQFMAVLSPPKPTTASSNNDLINGGISSAADAKQHCNQNNQRFGDIVNYYGISCADIGNAGTVTLQSSEGNNYYSIGDSSRPKNDATGRATNETPINIPGPQGKVYVRLLHSWDGGPYSTYQALKVKSSTTGKVFYILYDCGNLVSVGPPTTKIAASTTIISWPTMLGASSPANIIKTLLPVVPICYNPCRYNPAIKASSDACFKPCPIKGLQQYKQSSPKCTQPCPYNKKILLIVLNVMNHASTTKPSQKTILSASNHASTTTTFQITAQSVPHARKPQAPTHSPV